LEEARGRRKREMLVRRGRSLVRYMVGYVLED
jgi:hypothetical protein